MSWKRELNQACFEQSLQASGVLSGVGVGRGFTGKPP